MAFETVLKMKKNDSPSPVDDNVNRKILELDKCEVIDGAFKGTVGIVKEINESRQTGRLNVSAFGRNTTIEIHLAVLKVVA